jgi:O-succinylbenzoate synthase
VKLDQAEVVTAQLRLVSPIGTASGVHDRRPVVIVRLRGDDLDGVGECAALAEPGYTEEYAAGAESVLVDYLLPLLFALGTELPPVAEVMAALGSVPGNPMAKAAVEMALLDAEGHATGKSLATRIGATATSVPASATLGIAATPAAAADGASSAGAAGYRRLKMKIAPDQDVAHVAAVREACPDVLVVADANGSYSFRDAAHLRLLQALDELGLGAIEQPLASHDLVAHAELRSLLRTPVLLDESVESEEAVTEILDCRAADGLVIKSSRLGGLLAAARVHDRCRTEGVPLAVGGMLESGIGRAAAIALAALPGMTLPGDLGASDRYFDPDLTEPHRLDTDGRLRVPTGPGLGVEVCEDVLASVTERTRRVKRPTVRH